MYFMDCLANLDSISGQSSLAVKDVIFGLILVMT